MTNCDYEEGLNNYVAQKWLRSGSESLSHFSAHVWDVNQHPERDVNNLAIDKTVKFETSICYVCYLMWGQKFHNN